MVGDGLDQLVVIVVDGRKVRIDAPERLPMEDPKDLNFPLHSRRSMLADGGLTRLMTAASTNMSIMASANRREANCFPMMFLPCLRSTRSTAEASRRVVSSYAATSSWSSAAMPANAGDCSPMPVAIDTRRRA